MVLGETNRNYEEVNKQLISHEGKINKIYKDVLGLKTFGIGHLVLPTDNLQEGVEYSDDTIMEYFERDFQQALSDARSFIEEKSIDPDAFDCVINLSFNLGINRLNTFVKLKQALEDNDYVTASFEILDSRYATQVPNRANELAERLRDV